MYNKYDWNWLGVVDELWKDFRFIDRSENTSADSVMSWVNMYGYNPWNGNMINFVKWARNNNPTTKHLDQCFKMYYCYRSLANLISSSTVKMYYCYRSLANLISSSTVENVLLFGQLKISEYSLCQKKFHIVSLLLK